MDAKEVGSFKGGSAIRICEALETSTAVLVCIDTFLGDASMWLQHGGLMLQGGQPQLYGQHLDVESMVYVIFGWEEPEKLRKQALLA